MEAGMDQEELALKCSVKRYEISDIESGTAFYDPNLITMIERVTDRPIDRGRNKTKKKGRRKKTKKENQVW